MGHVVLHVKSVDDLRWFYEDVLGFGLSDYILKPFKAFFFHVNPRHHSLAMIETGRSGIHHVMMELMSLDDVGQAYDIAHPTTSWWSTAGADVRLIPRPGSLSR
jgi:catechol-2,3-dioxygenase